MATIRIRFVDNVGPAGPYIRAAQLGWPYTHVDAGIDGAWLGAHAAGGVALRPIGYDASTRIAERVYLVDASPDEAARFRAFLLGQIGKPYDFEAIAAFVAAVFVHRGVTPPARAWAAPGSWFCSELLAVALMASGHLHARLADDVQHVTPQNLAFALSAIAHIEDPAS